MISTNNLNLSFGGRTLFESVNVRFVAGNCYGLIGANGAGKSTFLKILAGIETPSSGEVAINPGERISFLRQDHFQFDEITALKTVIMGQPVLNALIEERDALYAKGEFTEADGERASELETEFADLNGWEAESDAAKLLSGLGIGTELHPKTMRELKGSEKIKVLLAQALFGNPDILLLDEPTNHLDTAAIRWLENFLYDFEKTVIVVSHDRHFLNKVCTHIADIDFGKITLFSGNYDFWYESSQLALRMQQEKNRRTEEKTKELKEFIARFSANASKSRQATSRKKLLDKLTLDDIKPSSRKYPFVGFKPEREAGDQLLKVRNLSKSIEGSEIFKAINFELRKGDKVVFTGNEIAITTLFQVLAGELKPDGGEFNWGITTSQAYFPKDNASFFEKSNLNLNLIDWLRQYSEEQSETFIRGFLGRMLFSGEETLKKVSVLSGGEKVRCMLSRMMLSQANVLILDGPTNHLDLESITSVNNGLMRFAGTVLFTSHDHQFNQTIANRVIEIATSGMTNYDMTYDEYLEKEGAPTMITAIGDVMRACYQRGWITTRDGNASLRRSNSKYVYITPSAWRKNLIYPELMIRVEVDSAKKLKFSSEAKPSGELHMHWMILKDATKTRAVVHAHPTHVVATMYRGYNLQKVCTQFPEIFRYTRVAPTVPALRATSKELGDATAEALGVGADGKPGSLKFDIVGQANHGVCSVAPDPWSAFEHIERLDHICEILLKSGVSPQEVEKQPKIFF